ncbi:MAG: nucleotidyltransferase domain-containing protein [Candidatus Promineifilaceae bacterium]
MSDPLSTLRAAVASHYSEVAGRRWRELLPAFESWQSLADLSLRLELGPLLYPLLRDLEGRHVPPGLLQALRAAHHGSAGAQLLAQAELDYLLPALAAAGVPVIVLKGAALAHAIYPQPAWRPMGDVDLLLPFDCLPQAREVLQAAGYGPRQPPPSPNPEGLFWTQEAWLKPNALPLELHWQLLDIPAYAPRLQVMELLARSRPFHLGGQPASALGLEDQLIHLCAHSLLHHAGGDARSRLDVGFLLARAGAEIDWPLLRDRAAGARLGLAVRQTLLEAWRDWYAPLPAGVIEAVERLRATAGERLYAHSQRYQLARAGRTFLTLPGWRPRLRFAAYQLWPAADYQAWRYGLPEGASKRRLALERVRRGLRRVAGRL